MSYFIQGELNMNYFELMNGLVKESFEFPQYKRMPIVYRILMTICLLPLILLDLSLFVSYQALAFLQKGLSTPADVLHDFVKKERAEVKHITQAIIYAIALPWIFFNYVLLSFISLMFYLIWFFIMLLTYIITLGGVTWQPFISEARYEATVQYEYEPSGNAMIGLVSMPFISIVLAAVFYLCIREKPDEFLNTCFSVCMGIYLLFILIINPLSFRKHPIPANCPNDDIDNQSVNAHECDAPDNQANNRIQSVDDNVQIKSNQFRCVGCDKLIDRSICPYCGTSNHKHQ